MDHVDVVMGTREKEGNGYLTLSSSSPSPSPSPSLSSSLSSSSSPFPSSHPISSSSSVVHHALHALSSSPKRQRLDSNYGINSDEVVSNGNDNHRHPNPTYGQNGKIILSSPSSSQFSPSSSSSTHSQNIHAPPHLPSPSNPNPPIPPLEDDDDLSSHIPSGVIIISSDDEEDDEEEIEKHRKRISQQKQKPKSSAPSSSSSSSRSSAPLPLPLPFQGQSQLQSFSSPFPSSSSSPPLLSTQYSPSLPSPTPSPSYSVHSVANPSESQIKVTTATLALPSPYFRSPLPIFPPSTSSSSPTSSSSSPSPSPSPSPSVPFSSSGVTYASPSSPYGSTWRQLAGILGFLEIHIPTWGSDLSHHMKESLSAIHSLHFQSPFLKPFPTVGSLIQDFLTLCSLYATEKEKSTKKYQNSLDDLLHQRGILQGTISNLLHAVGDKDKQIHLLLNSEEKLYEEGKLVVASWTKCEFEFQKLKLKCETQQFQFQQLMNHSKQNENIIENMKKEIANLTKQTAMAASASSSSSSSSPSSSSPSSLHDNLYLHCTICQDRVPNIVFTRCRHLCVCSHCVQKLSHCPRCQSQLGEEGMKEMIKIAE